MLSINSPAKINWFLKVLGRREDGYHEIHSVMQTISLHDTLTFEKTEGALGVITEEDIDIPAEENLIYKAAVRLRDQTQTRSGACITLTKRIPLQAGLGGGSSNAAATLKGLNDIWELDLSTHRLAEIGGGIGSDVPFFIHGGIAVAEGRGEVIKPINNSPAGINLLIVKPGFGVSTPVAYSSLKNYSQKDTGLPQKLINLLANRKLEKVSRLLSNDLEEPVFRLYPELKSIKNRLLENGALAALLCGSGSSVFGVFPDKRRATDAAERFSDLWHRVVETV